MFFNGMLKKTPEVSDAEDLLKKTMRLMEAKSVKTELIRPVDH